MLRVVHSNRSAALADALIEQIGGRMNPFEPVRVVVAGRLLQRWLTRQLAERHGVATGIVWQSFESMLVAAYTAESGRAQRLAVLDRGALPQALASVLSELGRPAPEPGDELVSALDPVRAYLDGGDALDVARRVQLAERLADLYWSYALSRPGWLQAWEKRRPVAELAHDPAAAWQAELWARLLERVSEGGRRRGARWTIAPLLPALRRELALPPPRLGAFAVIGHPYLTRAYLDALTDLALASEVTLYLVNPCQELWDDVAAGQLASEPAPLALWGRPIRDTVAALIERAAGDFDDRFVDPLAAGEPPAEASALAALWHDVLHRTPPGSPTADVLPARRAGVTVLACPSLRRELEVIGSTILQLLSEDRTLRAHEIAVLVAGRDADAYLEQAAAAFEAVGPVPCHLVDAPLAESGRIVDGLVALLELPTSKMTRRDLLRVMTHPAVIARYPHADAEQWVAWTERLGVARGADAASHRHTYLEEHGELFHWDQGIRRLAMGAFMVGERSERPPAKIGQRTLVPEELRSDVMASAATFSLLARSLIADALWMRDAVRPWTAWAEALIALVDAYLEPIDESAVHEIERTRRMLAELAEHDLDSRPVELREVRELVVRRLSRLSTDRGEALASGVMVAPLSSFRALPFRHVFIAGLGDDTFPSSEGRHALDLRHEMRFGDVSPRDRDRHTFFDAMLAAGDGVWLSYVALHAKSGDRAEPSPVIVELADALAPYLGADSGARALDDLTQVHPLHRFDERYRGAPGGPLGSRAPGTRREAWAHDVRAQMVAHLRARGSGVPDEDRLQQHLAVSERPALTELAARLGVLAPAPVEPAPEPAPSAEPREAPPASTGERGVWPRASAQRSRPSAGPRTLGVATLRDFLEHPVQAWARAVLGLEELADEILLEKSDEPFSVGAAERARLLRDVMAAHLRDPSRPLAQLYEAEVAARRLRSKFPVGVFGRAVKKVDLAVLEIWRGALGPIEAGAVAVARHGFGRAYASHTTLHDAIELEVRIGGELQALRLVGQTELLIGHHGSVIFKTGSAKEREHLRGAFDNLLLAAAGLVETGHCHVIIDGQGKTERVEHEGWRQDEARGYLTALATELFGAPHGYVLTLQQLRDALRGRSVRAQRITGTRYDDQLLGYGPIRRGDGLGEPVSIEALASRRLGPLVSRMRGDHPFAEAE